MWWMQPLKMFRFSMKRPVHCSFFFGKAGEGPGDMYLPAGIHIDYRNVAYFSNFVDKDFRLKYLVYTGNLFGAEKLNVYGFGDWVGEPLRGE